jgi:hypothetical protein
MPHYERPYENLNCPTCGKRALWIRKLVRATVAVYDDGSLNYSDVHNVTQADMSQDDRVWICSVGHKWQ